MQRGRSRADARRGPRIAVLPSTPAAIVPAAGRGERAGTSPDRPKQFIRLGGRALFLWAVDAVTQAGCSPVVLVVPDDLMELASAEAPDGVVLTAGGATRQDSVWNGLKVVTSEIVVVHDAARPMATAALVESVVAALDDSTDAVVAAVPVDETLKLVRDGDLVSETIDRSLLWRAQTPAAFRTDVLRAAHERAHADAFVGTDESQLVERYGRTIRVVPGTRDNLKVTFPEDFSVVEAMIETRLA
ncbi:MAG: 2-C-methyl-D-erythritol 4-phosphate cytidylyltransferase [Actinobacteria bacterium]|nr:2-C-methyl-D-erythritol 4-phosphate cytidylyltransferase [Actinomycetota bacterium]